MRRAARGAELARRRDERAGRRDVEISVAAAELLAEGDLTHETLAARVDVPVGFLHWAYPDTDDLAATADLSTAS